MAGIVPRRRKTQDNQSMHFMELNTFFISENKQNNISDIATFLMYFFVWPLNLVLCIFFLRIQENVLQSVHSV